MATPSTEQTAGGGGGAAGGGFDWSKLLSGGGALGAILGSIFGGSKGIDPKELARLFGPGALSGDTMQLYKFLAASPQFQQQLSQNLITSGQFSNNLAANLGARGLNTTGIGAIAGAAGQSAYASGEQALRGGLFGTASDIAQQNLLARLQSYTQGKIQQLSQPSPIQQIGGALGKAGGLASLFG